MDGKKNGILLEKLEISRRFQEIYDTVIFEFLRNKKKVIILIAINTLLFLLFFAIQQRQNSSEPVVYIQAYLGLIDILVLINSSALGGYVISQDYKEKTGHLLFPKINKERLFISRILAIIIMGLTIVGLYYLMVGIATLVKFDSFPTEGYFKSMMFAFLYMIANLSFVVFLSAVMKTPTLAIVIAILMNMMIFSIIEVLIGAFTTVEPTFMLTYYDGIISQIFDIPPIRYYDQEAGGGVSLRIWTTPTETIAIIGNLTWTIVCLLLAYLKFKSREFKG